MKLYIEGQRFIFEDKKVCYNIVDAMQYAYKKYEVSLNEFIQGYDYMRNNKHNCIHFGELRGSFLFSERVSS